MTTPTSPSSAPSPLPSQAPLATCTIAGGIATITMNDGKANVMSVAMLAQLNAALDAAQAAGAVVVLAGRERTFSGGFDLSVFQRDKNELVDMLEAGARLSERLLSYPHPVVAACTGHAVAMGVFLLLCADVRIGVTEGARVHINEVKNGMIVPHFALAVCRQRLAPAHLHHAVTTAQPYATSEALVAGFFDNLVPPADLLAAAQTRATELLALNAKAFTATKLRLQHSHLAALREAVARDLQEWSALRGA